MKKNIFILTTVLLLVSSLPLFSEETEKKQPEPEKKYHDVWGELSVFAPVQIFNYPNKRVTGFQFSLLYGTTYTLKGFSLGMVHSAAEDVTGLQLNMGNFSGGTIRGLQAGLINRSRSLRGMEIATLNITTSDVKGLQMGCINMATNFFEEKKTFLEDKTYHGTQIGFINITDNITGAQIGFINFADTAKGLQLGLVNISDSIEGVPIGFINIYTNGFWDISTFFSMNTLLNVAVKSRGKWSYGIFMLGYDPRSDRSLDRASLGFGFGFHFTFGVFYLDTDLTYNLTSKGFNKDLFNHDSGTSGGYATLKLRLLPGWQIIERVSVFAGPVCNLYPPINRNFGYSFDFNAGATITVF